MFIIIYPITCDTLEIIGEHTIVQLSDVSLESLYVKIAFIAESDPLVGYN